MRELLSESAVEVATVIGSAVGAVAFTVFGALTEQAGLSNTLAGQTTIGIWEMGFGLIALFTGVYMLGYHEFLTHLRALRREVRESA